MYEGKVGFFKKVLESDPEKTGRTIIKYQYNPICRISGIEERVQHVYYEVHMEKKGALFIFEVRRYKGFNFKKIVEKQGTPSEMWIEAKDYMEKWNERMRLRLELRNQSS